MISPVESPSNSNSGLSLSNPIESVYRLFQRTFSKKAPQEEVVSLFGRRISIETDEEENSLILSLQSPEPPDTVLVLQHPEKEHEEDHCWIFEDQSTIKLPSKWVSYLKSSKDQINIEGKTIFFPLEEEVHADFMDLLYTNSEKDKKRVEECLFFLTESLRLFLAQEIPVKLLPRQKNYTPLFEESTPLTIDLFLLQSDCFFRITSVIKVEITKQDGYCFEEEYEYEVSITAAKIPSISSLSLTVNSCESTTQYF